MELNDGQYQAGMKLVAGAETALQQVASGLRRREDKSQLRRRIEDVESMLKKIKRELGVG